MRPRTCRECGAPIIVKGLRRKRGRPRIYCEDCARPSRVGNGETPLSDRLKRHFRDWVAEREGEFDRRDVERELPCARRTALRLTRWAAKRGIILLLNPEIVKARGESYRYRYVQPSELPAVTSRPRRTPPERLTSNGRAPAGRARKRVGSSDRRVRDLIRAAEAAGWTATRTGGKHYKLTPPNGGQAIYVSATPGDSRALKNARAQLRRAGVSA